MLKKIIWPLLIFQLLFSATAYCYEIKKPGGIVYDPKGCSAYFPLFAFADALTVKFVSWTGTCSNGLMEGQGQLKISGVNDSNVNVVYKYDGVITSGLLSDYKGFFAVRKDGMFEPVAFVGYFLKYPVDGEIMSFVPFENKWVLGYVADGFEKGKITPRSVDMLTVKLPIPVLKNYASNVLAMIHGEKARKSRNDADKILHFMELIRQSVDNFIYLGKGLKSLRQGDFRPSDLDWGI